jgi:hypothetical protein
MTAGHMVPWSSDSWWMRFVPAYFNGTSLFGAGVESYVSDVQGYDTGGTGYDWAALRLYEPLGASLGYFGYNSYSTAWNNQAIWSNIGYPAISIMPKSRRFSRASSSTTLTLTRTAAKNLKPRIAT